MANNLYKNQHWQIVRNLSELPTAIREQIFSCSDNPFTSFEFLAALEQSECVGGNSGWMPHHFLYQNDQQYGLLIAYQKSHSYGEYVFDWSWADAYHRNGIKYYPKLLFAIPFSPIPCNKWLSNSALTELEAVEQAVSLLEPDSFSGWHYLFPESNNLHDNNQPDNNKIIERHGNQFHWKNQDQDGALLTNFEQYLGLMKARKRKNIIKERQKIQQMDVEFVWRSGAEMSTEELDDFYLCYHATYYKRGQSGYLNKPFFQLLCEKMPEQTRFLLCKKQQQVIASALYLVSDDTLFGRYWGSLENNELLHFEACYYRGIEFAITHKLKLFNPGTQGEHKISRGFVPTKTYSYHQLNIEPFHQAVADFCAQEIKHNEEYMAACSERLPFRVED